MKLSQIITTIITLMALLPISAQDAVNPCAVTGETYNCSGTGLHSAELEFRWIKLNGKKKLTQDASTDQTLSIETRLNYTKRAKAEITTTFSGGCPDRIETKRVKPEPTITYTATLDGNTYTGSLLEFEIPAPATAGSYPLSVTFTASGNCIAGTATLNKVFALNVSSGPYYEISAVKTGTTIVVDHGDYLCKNQGQDINLTADLSQSLSSLGLDQDDIVWSAEPASAGSFLNGATGETVTWRQANGYISATPDDVVFSAEIPGMTTREFHMTVVGIASASGALDVNSSATFVSGYLPAGIDKTRLSDVLSDLNAFTPVLHTYSPINLNAGNADAIILSQPVLTGNIVTTHNFFADGAQDMPTLKINVTSGSDPADAWLTLQRTDANGTDVMLHKEHVTVNAVGATGGTIVNSDDNSPNPITKCVGASVNLQLNITGTFDGSWSVTEQPAGSPAVTGVPLDDVTSGTLGPFNTPGKYVIATAEDDGTAIDDIEIHIRETQILDADAVSGDTVIPLFDPHPVVTLDPIAAPGGLTATHNVSGSVKGYLAPIDTVMVNGANVAVVQTNSGPDGLGPFTGTFNTNVDLDHFDTLIEAHAINRLNNIGKDSVHLDIMDFDITVSTRNSTAHDSFPAAPLDDAIFMDNARFKIRVVDSTIPGGTDTANVDLVTGAGTTIVQLTRLPGTVNFEAEIYLTPSHLDQTGLAAAIANTRIPAQIGSAITIDYPSGAASCSQTAVPTGIFLLKRTDFTDAGVIESGDTADVDNDNNNRAYVLRVGLHGSNGSSLTVTSSALDSLGGAIAQPLPANDFADLNPSITLDRVSNDPLNAGYHLYKMNENKPIMGVRDLLPSGGDSNNLTELYVHYDGHVTFSTGDLQLTESVAGMDIVAKDAATFAQTGLAPQGSPTPPILSIANGAPRPFVRISSATYVGTVANPTRFNVKGVVFDHIADLIDAATINDAGITLTINGNPIPAGDISLSRTSNSPLSRLIINFDTDIDLAVIPDATDVQAFNERLFPTGGGGFAGRPNPWLKIAQEAALVTATNALGNRGSDSSFLIAIETRATATLQGPFSGADGITAVYPRINTRTGDVPPKIFAHYHNPLHTAQSFNTTMRAKLPNGADIHTKNVTMERAVWGNQHRYGPFFAGTVDRTVNPAPAVGVDMPVMPTVEFFHDANGLVTGRDIASSLSVDAPGGSAQGDTILHALDLRVNDNDNDIASFLPTGTDAAPDNLDITARISNNDHADALELVFTLHDVSNYLGHCNNAPDAGGTNDDYAFSSGGNDVGPTPAVAFGGNGRINERIYVKDWGGYAVVEAQISNLPGTPSVYMALPMDADGDFLPDAWERRFRTINGVTSNNPIRDGVEDLEDRTLDGTAAIHNEKGDGFTALQEYRGFETSGVIARMDELPLRWGLAYTGSAANGDLVAGPNLKDLFIEINTTIPYNPAHIAEDFNLGFHVATPLSYQVDNRVGGQYTTWNGHNLNMNFNGNSDELHLPQNSVNILDDTHLTTGQLAVGHLGQTGSFFVGGAAVRLNPDNPDVLNGTFGMADNTGTVHFVTMNNQIKNANTIFHELAHTLSLVHAQTETMFTTALGGNNGNNFGGTATVDGVVDIQVVVPPALPGTFTIEGTAPALNMTRGSIGGHPRIGDTFYDFFRNGVKMTADAFDDLILDDFNGRISGEAKFYDTGAFVNTDVFVFSSTVYWPTLMDANDYPVENTTGMASNDGERLQSNLDGPQATVNSLPQRTELRIRTIE